MMVPASHWDWPAFFFSMSKGHQHDLTAPVNKEPTL